MADKHESSGGPDENSGDLDRPLDDDDLLERIEEEGTVVFSLAWDSGAPGMGADTEDVHELDGKYYYLSNSVGSYGPYDSLDEALDRHELLSINSITREIECDALEAQEILGRCRCQEDLRVGSIIRVNEEPWAYRGGGRFHPEK